MTRSRVSLSEEQVKNPGEKAFYPAQNQLTRELYVLYNKESKMRL